MIHVRFLPKSPTRFAFSAAVAAFLLVRPAAACTTFCLEAGGRVLFGANYDWDTGVGLAMINKRAVAKVALTGRPVRWTSRFASITFNQYGREFPTGGMNEAGLVVALMALDATEYPAVDSRPSVGILEWIQYQLDVSATIDDVILQSEAVRIARGGKGLHYLICDRSGRAATIEFLGGRLVAHQGDSLPVVVLTNNTYDDSVAYLRTITGFGGSRPVPEGITSLERFARAAALSRQRPAGADPVDNAFDILDAVHQPDYTKWSLVYDPVSGVVYFRTDRHPAVRSLSFAGIDGSCTSPVRLLNINGFADWADYTTEANMNLVYTAYAETPFLAGASEDDRRETALHADGDICTHGARTRVVVHP